MHIIDLIVKANLPYLGVRTQHERLGAAMIDLYFWTTPNGMKPLLFLEETGVEYRIRPVNISKGEQFEPEFLNISPNNRIPAL